MLRCVIGSPEIYLGEEKEENFKNRKQKYENQHVLSFGAHASPLANRVMVSSLPVVTEQTQRSYTFYTHFANEKTEAQRSSIYPRDLCFFLLSHVAEGERKKEREIKRKIRSQEISLVGASGTCAGLYHGKNPRVNLHQTFVFAIRVDTHLLA